MGAKIAMSNDTILKVTAYITRYEDGHKQLLVFREQGFEHLGYQVPGGTVEPNEGLVDALIREVKEEAGLVPMQIMLLGEYTYYTEATDRTTKRFYYQMEAECQETFTHVVQSNDEDNGWIYHYSWVNLDELSGLHGYLGVCLKDLDIYLEESEQFG